MKHLTTYKIFESTLLDRKEVYDYINDLFSDIKSNGVRVFVHHRFDEIAINIGEYSDQVAFKYSDISSEVEHMKSYFINDGNMRLGDVTVDTAHLSVRDLFGNGSRLMGWEKLKILNEKDAYLYSISINFLKRGVTPL